MQGFITISLLVLLGFIFFCIYFIFKQMQFVIQAINLYKDMVTRQDAMIKLLKDIRGNGDFEKDIEVKEKVRGAVQVTEKKGQHHWSDDDKTHNIERICPQCNDIYHGEEFTMCEDCTCALIELNQT